MLEGDVTEPLCGLDDDALARLSPQIDAVVHFAGLTDFDPDPLKALEINVHGAVEVGRLTQRFPKAKLLHCSTCYVAGEVSDTVSESIESGLSPNGQRFDPVAECDALRAACEQADAESETQDWREMKRVRIEVGRRRANALGWANVYTYTKALAEHLLATQEVEMSVIRPAVVECSRSYPFPGWNEGINTSGPLLWFLSGVFRFLPCQGSHLFDVVPVDTVSRATNLALTALLTGSTGAVYQLGSSQTNPLTFGRAVELSNLAARRYMNRDDAKPLERYVLRHLDSQPRDWDDTPLMSVPGFKRLSGGIKRTMNALSLSKVAPAPLKGLAQAVDGQRDFAVYYLEKTEKQLDKLQWMLDAYRPFIHDNNYVFRTESIRMLSERLVDEDVDAFGWDIDTLAWRDYWVNVLYPGVQKWTIPELKGAEIPLDPPLERPLNLDRAGQRRASKQVS